ncbi:MAG: LysE family translocator [Gammaproteobacteria bacterium]|nr:LysE family translocator [Gammaproteobacteria bacterium]
MLFELLRWLGAAYLAYLALQMLRSAFTAGKGIYAQSSRPVSLWRGFLTSFLNPKGLLIYFAVLPQFIDPEQNVAVQAIVLSSLFITGCAIVYGVVGLVSARASARGVNDIARRRIEGVAGTLLVIAAVRVASQ